MERGLFELYEMMDQIPEYGMMGRSNEEEQASLARGFFEIENMQQEMGANFNQPDSSQVFSHAPSLLPHRALHTRTLRSCRRFRGENKSVWGSTSTAFEKVTFRNHPSAPYTRYGHRVQQHHDHRIIKTLKSHSQQVIRGGNDCDVWVSTNFEKATIRNHPSAPYTKYGHHMQHIHNHRNLHSHKSHSQQINKHSSGPYPIAQLPSQVGCTQLKSVRVCKHSQQPYRGLTSGSLSSNALLKGIPLRNAPTAPSPYITQIKHNEKTSRYISQLTNKAISLKKRECFGNAHEDNCIQTKTEVDDNQFVDKTSFENCFENFLPNIMYDDSSSTSSPEQQYTYRTASLKPRVGYDASKHSTKLNSLKNEPAFMDTVSIPSEDKNEGKNCSGIGVEVLTCPTTCPTSPDIDTFLKEDSLQSSDKLTDKQDVMHQEPPKFSSCLPLPQTEELMDVNSPAENKYAEDEIEDGLKMDVSFSFMEKGGYHPIALPLGCHILEDDSASSEDELKDGSVLEKRMTKMGRDEFNLNEDNSSTFMPWIVIPLDEIPRVNYLDYVDFLNPRDPRLRKPVIEDSLNIEATDFMNEEPIKVPVSTEGDTLYDDQVLPNVETIHFENMESLVEEAEYSSQKQSQNHENMFDALNFSFSDSYLQKNVDSFDFSDKFLDSLTKDPETCEANEGLMRQINVDSESGKTSLPIFDTNKISGTSKIEKNLTGIPSLGKSPAENTLTNTGSINQCMQEKMGEDKTADNETSSVSPKTKKLPQSTLQLLKESFEFLKDQSLSRRRIRRLRRVSTALRVADFALPTYLEEFYVENESCNYTEQSENFPKNDKLKLVLKDCEPNKRGDFDDKLKGRPVTPRRSKRVAHKNIDYSTQKPQGKRERNGKGKPQQTLQDSPQVDHGKHSSLEKNPPIYRDEKTNSDNANKKELVIQFSGKKYKCNKGVLTPIDSEKSQKGGHLGENYDKNESKTQHIAKMKNLVVKRTLESKDSESFNMKSSCEKLESSQPKVLVQNCLQEIALSAGTSSKKCLKKSSKVHIIKKTTTVKKELFPKKNKNKCNSKETPESLGLKIQKESLKAKKNGNSVNKKKVQMKNGNSVNKKKVQISLNQTPSSKRSTKARTVKEKRAACALSRNGNASNSKKEYTASIIGKRTDCELQRKYVKPIIKVHQGLRNKSLKEFKEKQKGKKKNIIVSNKTASLKAFSCPNCEKRFSKASQIHKHIKEDHQCSQCEELCVSKTAKQTHFYFCHAAEVHVCLTCHKRYSQPYHLRKHFETRSHKELIRCLLNEIKKIKGGKSVVSKRLSVEDNPSKSTTLPHKGLDHTSDQALEKYDHFAQVRSKRKQKFMEMESSFFDQNPDLLELVHKIDYVDGQSNIVKHYLYKDPDLAEIQSRLKEESHDSFYEEIEIINECSITSHCENFLEDSGCNFAISDRKRSFENRYSETSTFSEYSEQDSAYSSSCYPNNQYQDFDPFNTVGYKDTKSGSAVSGWFSAAMDAIEQRNLEDDSSYSTYLGVVSSDSEHLPASNPTTLQTFNETCQKTPSEGSYTSHSSMAVSRSNLLNQYPLDSQSSFLLNEQELSNFDPDRNAPVIPISIAAKADQASAYSTDLSSYSAGYDFMQNPTVNTTDEKKNVLLDVAKSLILLSNPEPFPNEDYISTTGNSTFVKPEDEVQREWESICSEIEKDVRDY